MTLTIQNQKGNAIVSILVIAAIVAVIIFVLGIGDGVINPDVRTQYRESLVGNGYVLIITNAGSKPLFHVTVGCEQWKKRYIVSPQLNPGDKAEAGWLELPEGIKKGREYLITADGYAGNCKVHIQ